ncbi:hypothetical protein ACWDE9_28300 [Streptomyces olivaceoviridis]
MAVGAQGREQPAGGLAKLPVEAVGEQLPYRRGEPAHDVLVLGPVGHGAVRVGDEPEAVPATGRDGEQTGGGGRPALRSTVRYVTRQARTP